MMNTIHLDHLGYINTYIYIYTANSWGLPGTQRRNDNRIIIIIAIITIINQGIHVGSWLYTYSNVTAANRLYNSARIRLKLTRIQAAAGRTFFLLKPPLVCHPQSPAGRQGPGRHCGYWSHLSNSVKFKEKQQVNWNNNLSWNTKVSLRPLRNVSTRESRRTNRTQRIECMKRSASYRMLEVQNLVQTKTKARVKFWHCFNLTLHVTNNRLQESQAPHGQNGRHHVAQMGRHFNQSFVGRFMVVKSRRCQASILFPTT